MGYVLTINSGSSSVKFALFEQTETALVNKLQGLFERVGSTPPVQISDSTGKSVYKGELAEGSGHKECVAWLINWLKSQEIVLAGAVHRVVHGGAKFSAPTLITAQVRQDLEQLSKLAPLHQPHNLAGIDALSAASPGLPQVACFDTAFHASAEEDQAKLPLPQSFFEEGLRRYGFHGLSYEYIASLESIKNYSNVVVLHLGSGASACAIKNGKSMASTMGFSTLDGLIMGTRCGSLDVGVVLHLLKQGMHLSEVEALLYKKSGLLGISGLSNDCRDLEIASQKGHKGATQALEMFAQSIAGHVARLITVLGSIDALVFTAGIGEHSSYIRALVCEKLKVFGVFLEATRNASHAQNIQSAESAVPVMVLATNEELMMARHGCEIFNT